MARKVSQIVEEQIRTWVRQQEERLRKEREEASRPTPWPVITVSRAFGALGAALAREIGRRTGFAVWDDQLVHAVAEETGADEAIIASLDEARRGAVEDAIEGALMGMAYTSREYAQALMRIVHTIANHGGAVIVGRGAQYVLEPESILRVRMVAPLDKRIQGFAERSGLELKQARQRVERMDQQREHFIRQHFGIDLGDPSGYDVVINSHAIRCRRAVDIVLAAYTAKFDRVAPSREAESARSG